MLNNFWWWLFIVLIMTDVFLVVVNGFLRGRLKGQIDVILSIIWIALLVGVFVFSGWGYGLGSLVGSFVFGALVRPFARKVAIRFILIGDKERPERGRSVGLPPRHLLKISEKLGRLDPIHDVNEVLSGQRTTQEKAQDALLDYCEGQTAIRVVMNEFQISRDNLRELYNLLLMVGAGQWVGGHWVAASALAYPETLHYLIVRKESDIETGYNLISYFERGKALPM